MEANGQKTGASTGPPAAGMGVLLLGIALFPVTLLFNPLFLNMLWPLVLRACPDWHTPAFVVHLLLLVLVGRMLFQWRRLGATRLARLLFEHKPLLGGALHALLFLLAFLLFAECLFSTLNGQKEAGGGKGDRYVPSLYRPDAFLGYRANHHDHFEHLCYKKAGREPIFKKTYTLNPDGTRFVPQPAAPKTHHLAFFGCSLTFGVGSDDHEAYPARVATQVPEAHVYNFAFGSFGPGQTYLQLAGNVTQGITEREGAAFFLFFPDHVARLLPRIRYATLWASDFPAFELDTAGKPRYIGALSSANPWRMAVLEILKDEHYIQWSNLDFPIRYERPHLDLAAALLAAAREEYRERFPGNEFYVILNPDCFYAFKVRDLKECLHARGVPFLNAKTAYDSTKLAYPIDLHPTPEAHALLADWLVKQFPGGFRAAPLPDNFNR